MEGILSSCEEEERCVIFDILFPISSSTYRIYIFRHASLLGWKKVTSDAIISTQYNKITHCCRRNNNKILWVIHLQANDGRRRRRFFISTSSLHIALHHTSQPDHFRINSARVVLYVSAANGIRYIYAGCVDVIALSGCIMICALFTISCAQHRATLFRFVLIKHHGSCSRMQLLKHILTLLSWCASQPYLKSIQNPIFRAEGEWKVLNCCGVTPFLIFDAHNNAPTWRSTLFAILSCCVYGSIKKISLCVCFSGCLCAAIRDNKDPCLIAGHDQNFR